MQFLLLTTNFAPRGTSHAVRTVHLARYLVELGHSVSVLTYTAETQLLFSPADPSIIDKVPESVDVQRIAPGPLHRLVSGAKRRGTDTRQMRTSGSRSRLAQFVVPDPHIGAYLAFQRAASRLIGDGDSWTVVTFAYPYTLTLVGAALKRRHPAIHWIADYGDPWTGSPVSELRLPAWRRALDARLESRALGLADAVTVTTEPTAQLYRDQFPGLGDRVHVVTMGYDPADAAAIAPAPRAAADEGKTVLLHAGRLYSEARDPAPFIAAVDACLAADPDAAARLKIVLLGEVEPAIEAAIRRSRAADLWELHGWVTVEQSVARMKAADALLLFGNSGNMQIPGKVYQYIGTGRPVFMTCESDGDPTADVLRQYGRGAIVANREADLTAALQQLLAGNATGNTDPNACQQFSWPSLAARLAGIAETARAGAAGNAAEATS